MSQPMSQPAQTPPDGASASSATTVAATPLSETAGGPRRAAPALPQELDDWLAVEPDGTVVVSSGKVELGTGVRTALSQIIAEELGMPLAYVRLVMGETGRSPDEGYTAGSKTIQTSGMILRRVAAEARAALLDLAAARFAIPSEALEVSEGAIFPRAEPAHGLTFADLLAGGRFNRTITGAAPLKRPEEYRLVGSPVSRVDLPAKFTGQPAFVHDLRLPGMLHARVVRPAANGERAALDALDASAVRDAQVIRHGDFLAVVAETEPAAIRAAGALRTTWRLAAVPPQVESLHDWLRAQPVTTQVAAERGDVDAALAQAPGRVSASYCTPFQAHASIGPSCAVADDDGETVTVWCSTQGVYPLRGALADLLGLPEERVRVIHREGAGAYGQNGADDVAADAAVLARDLRRPVRVQWSRADEFAWEPKGPAMAMDLRGGLDATGAIVAWDYEGWTPSHANRPRRAADFIAGRLMGAPEPPPRGFFLGGDRNAPTNYTLPNERVTMRLLAREPLRVSSLRSLGAFANTFANESFMDELAAAAHTDPLAFRLRALDDPRARAVVEAAGRRAAWGEALPAGEGRGIAFTRYENIEAYVAAVAHVAVDAASGAVRVRRVTVAHDCGQIINPDGVRNQIEGNVIQSLSRALKEEARYDAAGVTSLDWETYPIIRFSEVPEIEIELIDRPDQPPLGAGEPAGVVIAPAVANAIYAATGARLRQLPCTPARVREALASR